MTYTIHGGRGGAGKAPRGFTGRGAAPLLLS